MTRIFACLGALALLSLTACGESDSGTDDGPLPGTIDLGVDGGSADAGGPDLGSPDFGPPDDGVDAGPPRPTTQSEINILPSQLSDERTLRAVDGDGEPLTFTAVGTFDVVGDQAGDELIGFVGADLYVFTEAAVTDGVFRFVGTTTVDGSPRGPDDVVRARLDSFGFDAELVGVFGDEGRVLDTESLEWTDRLGFSLESGGSFAPRTVTRFRVPTTSQGPMVALDSEGQVLHSFSEATRSWFPLQDAAGPLESTVCSSDEPIQVNLLVAATTAGSGAEVNEGRNLIAISGSSAYILEDILSNTEICFSEARPIRNASAQPFDATLGTGWDFDNDNLEDAVLVRTIPFSD